jgi:F-type H+-transporting ATPase subunit epsilon
MADKILFEIVTPERLVFSEEVDEVIVPGVQGEMGFLPGHLPLLSGLQIGQMALKKEGKEIHFAISGGYVEIHEDHVILLAETAERADEIDVERAMASKARAEESLKKIDEASVHDFMMAELRLKRALTREEVSKRR